MPVLRMLGQLAWGLALGIEVAFCQTLVSGQVLDLTTQQGLAQATVRDPDTGQGTTTDAQGRFSLLVQARLVVSHVGYQTLEVPAAATFLRIALETDAHFLQEVTIQAFQSEKNLLQTPGAVSLLTRLDLERDQELSLAPALNRVPGVYMHQGTLNTSRLTIRGIGSRQLFGTGKIRAYWNDIPLTSGEATTDLDDLDLSLLGRVEVLKGPASSIYGAGLGGTLLLQSQKADYAQTQVQTQSTLGSFGLWRQVLSFKSGQDRLNLHLNYNHTQSEGWRENNAFDRNMLTLSGEVYDGEKQSLQFLASWLSLKAFIPSAINRESYEQNPQAAAPNWAAIQGFEDYNKLWLGLAYQRQVHPHWEVKSSVFTNFRTNYEPRPFNILRENNQRIGLRSRVVYEGPLAQKAFQATAGGEYFREWYAWQTYGIDQGQRQDLRSDQDEVRDYFNLFAQAFWEMAPGARLEAGLNYHQTQYRVVDFFQADGQDQSGNYRFEGIWSPRLAFNYQWRPNLSAYTSLSHGFAPPTVEETLNPAGQINPDIRPEQGWSWELGQRGNWQNGRGQFDLVLYWMWVKDLLVARRTAEDQFIGVNAGKTWHRGVELSTQYRLSPDQAAFRLDVFANYAFNFYTFQEFVEADQDFSGNQLTGVPRHVFNAGLDLESRLGLYGHLTFQFTDRIPIRDDNSVFAESYALWHIRLGWRAKLGTHLRADVHAGVQNIFDQAYSAMLAINAASFGTTAPRYYYPGLPRHYFGGLRLHYVF